MTHLNGGRSRRGYVESKDKNNSNVTQKGAFLRRQAAHIPNPCSFGNSAKTIKDSNCFIPSH